MKCCLFVCCHACSVDTTHPTKHKFSTASRWIWQADWCQQLYGWCASTRVWNNAVLIAQFCSSAIVAVRVLYTCPIVVECFVGRVTLLVKHLPHTAGHTAPHTHLAGHSHTYQHDKRQVDNNAPTRARTTDSRTAHVG
jgi:hypothetical protein